MHTKYNIMSDEVNASGSKSCTFTFKRSAKRAQNTRRREVLEVKSKRGDSSSASSEDETKVVRKHKKANRFNPLVSSTGSLSSTRQTRQRQASSSSDQNDEEVKESRSRVGVYYESSKTGERSGPTDQGATAIVETETEKDRDAQAIYERSLQTNKELGKVDDQKYRGMNNYVQFIEKKDTSKGNAASGGVRKGPIRAPDNLRSTVRWDYQPDICKDYKETGFCTFGDSCKFLHDRSDYKFGWQIEREVQEGRYGAADNDATKYEISDSDDELPFKCFICKESFIDPIITKCKHYFCEKCALQNYKKSSRCYICSAQTGGVFNPAKEIINRLNVEEQAAHAQHRVKSNSDEEDSSD
ncbi:unnamed protein product [Allacma fusca]|uniref:RING finger protein 113A n=1 Tax=Allacma fusca TaxID=39272 RepID=A0A8J2PI89_9HEXA|nr:unnamed protein product [Allacma fusca]